MCKGKALIEKWNEINEISTYWPVSSALAAPTTAEDGDRETGLIAETECDRIRLSRRKDIPVDDADGIKVAVVGDLRGFVTWFCCGFERDPDVEDDRDSGICEVLNRRDRKSRPNFVKRFGSGGWDGLELAAFLAVTVEQQDAIVEDDAEDEDSDFSLALSL